MVPEKQINEFVDRLRQAAGENLQSVILYGSAAGGEFHPEFSNVNLLCILRDTSFPGSAPSLRRRYGGLGRSTVRRCCSLATNWSVPQTFSPSSCSICSSAIACSLAMTF